MLAFDGMHRVSYLSWLELMEGESVTVTSNFERSI